MIEQTAHSGDSRRTIFGKAAYAILLVVSVLLPVFFVPVAFISTQFGTSLLFGFGVILAAIAYIIFSLQTGSFDLPRPAKYFLLLTVLVPVVYLLAGIANGFSRMAFLGYTFDQGTVGFIFLAFLYMFLVSVLFREKKHLKSVYLGFAGAALLTAIFFIIRFIFGPSVLSFGMFTDMTGSVIGSWTNVGIFFGLTALLSLLTLEGLSLSKRSKILLIISLLGSLFFVMLAGFTFIWVVLGVSALLYVLYSVFSKSNSYDLQSLGQRFLRSPRYAVFVVLLSIIFVIWGGAVSTKLSTALKVSSVEVRPTWSVTFDIARNTLTSRPLFGSGPNSFVQQWLTFKPDDITSTIFWNTDFASGIGLIPTFAVTTGFIGFLSWLVFIGFFLYFGFKTVFARVEDLTLKYFILSSFFLAFYLWLVAFVYVPSTVIFILAFLFTGLFFASAYGARIISVTPTVFSYNPKAGFASSLAMVVCFVGCAALGYGLYQNSISLWYFQKSSYALNTSKDIAAAENYMAKAIDAVPQDIYYRALSEIELYKLGVIASQDPKKVDQAQIQKQFSDTLSTAIKAGMAARDSSPSNYLNWIALARVYEAVADPALKIDGAYESAVLSYSEALRRNPKNPAIFVLLSRLAYTRQDLVSAGNYALQAIQLKRNYTDAYFLLAQIQIANKDIKSAIQSVAATTIIDPTNPGTFFQLGFLKFNAGDFGGAIEALEKAISLTPDYANAKYYLGLSYEALGQHEKAIAQFTDLAKSNPDNQEVAAILSSLKAGKPIFSNTVTPTTASKPPVKEKAE